MQKHVRLILRAARRLAEEAGGVEITLDPEGSHQTLVVVIDGVRVLVGIPGSPRDPDNAVKAAVQAVKRIIRGRRRI